MTARPTRAEASEQSTDAHERRSSAIDARKLTLPVTVVITAAVVVGGWIWWLSDANARLNAIETRAKADAILISEQAQRLGDVRVREAEILARLAGIEAQLSEIKVILRDRRP